MSHRTIRRLYEGRLASWADSMGYPVAYQNSPFTPQSGQLYLRTFLIPADTGSDDLAGEHRRYQGLFQVNVVSPAGQGSGQAETIVMQLADLFPVNMLLSDGDFSVQIVEPVAQGPEIQDATEYTTPASFSYRADTP